MIISMMTPLALNKFTAKTDLMPGKRLLHFALSEREFSYVNHTYCKYHKFTFPMKFILLRYGWINYCEGKDVSSYVAGCF